MDKSNEHGFCSPSPSPSGRNSPASRDAAEVNTTTSPIWKASCSQFSSLSLPLATQWLGESNKSPARILLPISIHLSITKGDQDMDIRKMR